MVQNFPQLQNLRQDLEKSIGLRKVPETQTLRNFSQSLPAHFHQNGVQNVASVTNSLPTELDNGCNGGPEMDVKHVSQIGQNSQSNEVDITACDKVGQHLNNGVGDELNGYGDSLAGHASLDDEDMQLGTAPRDSLLLYPRSGMPSGEDMQDSCDQERNVPMVVGFSAVETSSSEGNIDQLDDEELEYLNEPVTAGGVGMMQADNQSEPVTTGGMRMMQPDNQSEPVTAGGMEMMQQDNQSDRSSDRTMPVMEGQTICPQTVLPSQPVITDLNKVVSPCANVSLDSGCVSMSDNVTVDEGGAKSTVTTMAEELAGARPKEFSYRIPGASVKTNDLQSMDISSGSPCKVSSDVPIPAQVDMLGAAVCLEVNIQKPFIEGLISERLINESRQMMESETNPNITPQIQQNMSDQGEGFQSAIPSTSNTGNDYVPPSEVEMRRPGGEGTSVSDPTGRPRSWSPESGQQHMSVRRPNSLNLPPPPTIDPSGVDQEPASDQDMQDMEKDTQPEHTDMQGRSSQSSIG